MREVPSRPKVRFTLVSWPAAATAVLVAQAIGSFGMQPGTFLSAYTMITYFLLLMLAVFVASGNALRGTLGQRPFWVLLAAGYGLWALDQWLWIYYELGLRTKIPDSTIADPALFLHVVPFLAALATRPDLGQETRERHQTTLNFLLLLLFWVFLYAFLVFPFQFLPGNATIYNLRYNVLYFAENLAVIVTAGFLIVPAKPPWQSVYWHLLGATSVYSVGSLAANTAIDLGGYFPGHWTDLVIIIAICWFAWIPLRARRLKAFTPTPVESRVVGLQATTLLAMIAILLIPVMGAWELLQPEDWWMHRFRLLVVLSFTTLLALAALIRRYIENRELKEKAFTSDQMRRVLAEASPVPIVTVDPEGKVTSWNAAAERVFGWTESEVLGRPLPNVRADELEKHHALRALTVAGQGVNGVEVRRRRKDGTLIDLTLSTAPLHDPKGKVMGIVGVMQDITERKRADEALQLSEQRYRDFISHSKDGVWRVELERPIPVALPVDEAVERLLQHGCFAECNDAMARISGLASADDLVGKHLGDLVSPSDQGRIESFRSAARDGWQSRTIQLATTDVTGKPKFLLRTEIPIVQNGMVTRIWGMTRDITGLKRAEDALAESQARMSALVESTGDMIWSVDAHDFRLLTFNTALKTFFAWTPNPEVQLGMTPEDLLSPKLAAQWREFYLRALREGSFTTEYTSDLLLRTLLLSFNVLKRGEEVFGISVFAKDISDRKRAEDALAESEGRFRSLVENATVGIYRTTPEGRVVMANPALVKMMGYDSFGELARRNLETNGFEPKYPRSEFKARLEQEDEVRGLEAVWTRRDGTTIFVRESARAIRAPNGGVLYYDGIVEDITERKRAEETLVKLRQAVEMSGEVVFMTDREGTITSVNPEFTRLYGYAEGEIVGKTTPRILKSGTIPPEDYANFWKTILEKHVVRGEVVNKTKDGRLVAVESSANAILDGQGNITGFLAIQRDVTGRKQLEEQFRQAQKMEAVGRLAGGIAHDFNNLLTIINGYSQLLLEQADPTGPTHYHVEAILTAGGRAKALTRQLLAFSRKQVLELRILDLNGVLEGMERMLRPLIGEDIELVTKPGRELGQVRVDPAQIEQVIMNLAVNARDAMARGGKLIVETCNCELDESYAATQVDVKPGCYVMLAVSDTGHGMDAETVAHIFEPFFTTKEQGKGTGLGLSTVYGIVKQTGGHVTVYSEPGRGTTFKVYLPRLDGHIEAAGEQKKEEVILSGSETILVVEDEEGVRALVRNVLERQNYTVLLAGSPADAVKLSERHKGAIHLLLTDVIMPGFSGKVLADRLAASRPDMKVLFISGYTADATFSHGIVNPKTAFLQKPFTPKALLRKVRETLEKQIQIDRTS
jgi:two-component system cell cycle sensor histidine kinase/response regulator CckA